MKRRRREDKVVGRGERELLECYGEAPVFNEPGVFILDADGTLYWSNVSSMPFGRPALDDVIARLQLAQQQDYPARGAA